MTRAQDPDRDPDRPYRVLRGRHGRWEGGDRAVYTPGDIVLLTPDRATRLVDVDGPMVEDLGGGAGAGKGGSEAREPDLEDKNSKNTTGSLSLSGMDWRRACGTVRGMDDPSTLARAQEEESADRSRPSVLHAIKERLADLEDDPGHDSEETV